MLVGGADADTILFSSPLSTANVDRITDFSVPDDTIQLSRAIFSALTATGTLAADEFHTGSAAHDVSDRILYDPSTGSVAYDRDGTDSAEALEFALLAPGLPLSNADFLIV